MMEIASFIISVLSLFATIAISIVIYKLDKKHLILNERKNIEHEARLFIINNAQEKDYICLAMIAAWCFPQNNHIRKIYNEFSILREEVKQEVLRQLNIDIPLIRGTDWIDSKISFVKQAIKDLDIGRDFLYEGAKYFHRLYKYKDESFDSSLLYENNYDDVFGIDRIVIDKNGKVSFGRYLDDYLYFKFEDTSKFSEEWAKPLDYMIEVEELRYSEEAKVCFWISEEILETMSFAKKYLDYDIAKHNYTDANIETFEDRYFDVLYELFFFEKKE